LVGVYNGTTQKLYIDGVEEDSDIQSGVISDSEEEVCVGVFCNGGTQAGHFDGNIADVLIYDRALSADEALELYQGADVAGAILDMPLSDKTGFKDISGNDYHGTNHGADIIGEAGGFDGVDDYVKMDAVDSIKTDNFTIGFWFNPKIDYNNLVGRKDIMGDAKSFWLIYNYSSGKLSFLSDGSGSSDINYTTTFDSSNWYYIVLSKNRTTNEGKIYINGILKRAAIVSANPLTPTNLYMGWAGYSTYYSDINISDVNIYNRILSDGEVSVGQDAKGEIGALYAKGRSGSAVGTSTTNLNKGLVGQWDLKSKDEKVGSELHPNWDMENGTASWSFDGKGSGTINSEASDYFSGSKSLRVKNATGGTIAVWDPPSGQTIGSLYRVSVWAKNIDCPTIPFFSSSGATRISGNSSFTGISTTEWKYYSAIFRATTTTPSIYIRTAENAIQGEFLLDNFNLKPVHRADSTPYGNHTYTNLNVVFEDDYLQITEDSYISQARVIHNENINFDQDTNFSLSVWVKDFSTTGGGSNLRSIFSKGLFGGGFGIGYLTSSGDFRMGVRTTDQNYNYHTINDPDDGLWHNLTMIYLASSKEIYCYLDGVLEIQSVVGGNQTFGNTEYLSIGNGRPLYGSNDTYEGKISDGRIYNRALSGAEVKLLYDKGR